MSALEIICLVVIGLLAMALVIHEGRDFRS